MQIALLILILSSLVFIIIYYRYNAIYFIPVFFIVFDVIRGWFSIGSYFGTIRNISYFLLIGYVLIMNKKTLIQNIWIPIFLLYVLFLVPLSSNIKESATNFIVLWNSLFTFSLGLYFFKNIKQLKELNKFLIIMMFIFVINAMLSSTLGIGRTIYGGSLTMGGFAHDRLYSGSIFLILLPIITPLIASKPYRILLFICSIITYILLVISMRRTAFLVPLLGFLVYFFLTKNKNRMIFIVLLFVFLIAAAFPLYKDTLINRLNARLESFDNTLTEEYRYKEIQFVFKETFSTIKTALIGKEVLNSVGNYNEGLWGARPLHTDFAVLLHGSGIVGVILFSLIYLSIINSYFRYVFLVPKIDFANELNAIFIALFVSTLFISVQGGLLAPTFRAILLLYMGAILGIFKNYKLQHDDKLINELDNID